MSERLLVTPFLRRATDLFLEVRQAGPGALTSFAVEVMLATYTDAGEPKFPAEFAFAATRRVNVNGQREAFRVYRMYWSPPRRPLLPGIAELVLPDPIVIAKSDLVPACVGLRVVSEEGPGESIFYGFTDDLRLSPLTGGQVEVVPDSDVPSYGDTP